MELNKFKKDLRALKEGEKIDLGLYVFYVQDNFYHVYNTHDKKEENKYRLEDYLLIYNDFRFSIQKNSEKLIKRLEKLALKSKFTEAENEKTN